MRIIAGTNKGRTLTAPKWAGLRPTSDKLRETLFNIIAPSVPGARVLDVFAGTGAIALEALSRGASAATCIDHDRRAWLLIADNRDRCGEAERCMIVRAAAERALSTSVPGGPFEIVILDPPYDFAALDRVVELASRQRAPGGLLVLEHASRVAPPTPAGLVVSRTVTSGDSALTFYA